MVHEVTRTLVKSQPEIWAQCSVADSLERHLSRSFGEIRITRLEPEHAVAWEGEQVRGTVTIEPSAWGTRVTMAVQLDGEKVAAPVEAIEPVQAPPPAELELSEGDAPPPAAAPPAAPRPPGRVVSWWGRLWRAAPADEEPVAEVAEDVTAGEVPVREDASPVEVPEAPPAPPESPDSSKDPEAALNSALESLGQAHHRPYSRA